MPDNVSNHSLNSPFHPYSRNEKGQLYKSSHNSIRLPSWVNEWAGWRRLNAKTAVPTFQAIPQGLEVDFDYFTLGNIQNSYIELTMFETGVGNSTFNPYNLFERIEIRMHFFEQIYLINQSNQKKNERRDAKVYNIQML